MQYKTMVLELLRQRPEAYDQLQRRRILLQVLNLCASDLKGRHEVWKAQLALAKLGASKAQLASEALEMALKEIESRLPSSLPLNEGDQISLDQVMAYIWGDRPPA